VVISEARALFQNRFSEQNDLGVRLGGVEFNILTQNRL